LSFANDFVVVYLTCIFNLKSEKMMRRITLNIPENKFAFFLKLVRSLNFVQIENDTTLEEKPIIYNSEFVQKIKQSQEEFDEGNFIRVEKKDLKEFIGL
jgi:hypothetical protein